MPEGRARIAVLGAGWWAAHVYIPELLKHPDAELVAVSRLGAAELARVQAEFGIARGYEDFRELLAAERPDGVGIASPHVVHHAMAKAALEAGCHVLVDKPMTTSAGDARELVALADGKGLGIIIPHGWNFKDFSRRAMALMAEGAVGEVRHVVCQMASPTRDLFAGEGLAETQGHMFRPPVSTWADPAQAGGYGWGQLSHALGLMFALVDLPPAEVMAFQGASPAGVDWYDAAILRFANGATGVLSGSSTVPKQAGYQLDIRIFGTEGMLLVDVERERMELRRDDGADEVMDVPRGAGAYDCAEPVARLVELCRGTARMNEAPGLVGMRAVEVLDALYRSARSGRAETC
ncbi:MAG: Gfo/Idh/MocA family oxidoreductase [Rhodobacteraceae bacterium]|nr:Gfo/Idh/MocA family oxidoreductase [Paracoccaceae bacterium]